MNNHLSPPSSAQDMSWLIEEFAKRVPGLTHVVVMSMDGLQLGAAGNVDRTLSDSLAAIACGLLSMTRQVGQLLDADRETFLTLQFPDSQVALMRIGDSAGLFVAVQRGTKMTVVGSEMTKFVSSVGDALSPTLRAQMHQSSVAAGALQGDHQDGVDHG
jgi:hypothetical protein